MAPAIDLSGVSQAASRRPVPGEREPGVLTTSKVIVANPEAVPDGPGTLDAATIAERQREGGGAPSQRKAPREHARWWRRGM